MAVSVATGVDVERVGIVGSRDYPHLGLVRSYVQSLAADTIVVSGGAPGVDRVAADEAANRKLAVEIFPADWQRHGKRAGILRNHQLIATVDRVVAFWDGHSRGTQHMIGLARARGMPIDVIGLLQ